MAAATHVEDLDVRRLSGSLGAEVRGIALETAGPADAERLESLLMEHQVLFFPDQHLDPDQHIAFGRLFGELESHPNLALGGEPFGHFHHALREPRVESASGLSAPFLVGCHSAASTG